MDEEEEEEEEEDLLKIKCSLQLPYLLIIIICNCFLKFGGLSTLGQFQANVQQKRTIVKLPPFRLFMFCSV